MIRETLEHCERRAAEEWKAAAEADCTEAAIAHRGLAEKYQAQAKALRARQADLGAPPLEPTAGSRPLSPNQPVPRPI